jgi:hypothetical protein
MGYDTCTAAHVIGCGANAIAGHDRLVHTLKVRKKTTLRRPAPLHRNGQASRRMGDA